MVEAGISKPDKTEFTECWRTITEASPARIRGALVSSNGLLITTGQFLSYLINLAFVRRGLAAGITVQVAQQFVGINTVMYYSPMIVQFAGFASNKTALALSLITSGLNAVGSVISMMFVDRYGRRRLMIVSMIGIISCFVALRWKSDLELQFPGSNEQKH